MKFLLVTLALMSNAFALEHFKVHEWGTFTSLVGSNGARQEGMFHEDELLPNFVHNFGETSALIRPAFFTIAPGVGTLPQPNPPQPRPRPGCGHSKIGCDFLAGQVITQKMETPVLYFHSDVPRKVTIDVGFPQGIISQTFPAPVMSSPLAVPGVRLTNGFARFNVDVLTKSEEKIPYVDPHNIYFYARNVKANTIKSKNEAEKFIFYRGLGKFETKLSVSSKNGSVRIQNSSDKKIPAAFLVDINNDGGAILSLGDFKAKENKLISDKNVLSLKSTHKNFSEFKKRAKAKLLKALVANGLYTDEAEAMVNTWEHGYFRTKGLRVLYVLNRDEVESILPMNVTPRPSELNRVFVGRIEVLLDTEENEILTQILKERSEFDILGLGRFAPSIISRIHELAKERGVLDANLQKTFDEFNQIIATKL
ncbi:MAG: hypothetical protein ACXVLQ_07085 [Bacteriovorax sp.]